MKIVVVGNSGGGKTELSRKLAAQLDIPVHHVDSLQFTPDLTIRPHAETIRDLEKIQSCESWIIDGYGPLDILEKRFALADKIIFVDFPIWRHYWWATKRQIKNLWSPRKELPKGASELTLQHTIKLYKSISQVHNKMRPELLRIFSRSENKEKMIYIRTLKDYFSLVKTLDRERI